MLIILMYGIVTFFTHPSQEDPTITIREAVITTFFEGMSVDRVENLITKKIEENTKELAEVKDIYSTSKTGVSIVHVTLHENYFDLDKIWQKLRNKIHDVKTELPQGTVGPYINDEFGTVFVAVIALTGDGFTLAEMHEELKAIRNELYAIKGIEKIKLHGIQKEKIYIELNNTRLAQYGINPHFFFDAIKKQNTVFPAGIVRAKGENYILEPSGHFASIEELKKVVVKIPGSKKIVYLEDIANVKRGYVDPKDKPVYFKQMPALSLAVSMHKGENIVEFGKRLKKKIKNIQNTLPIGYQLHLANYQPEIVEKSIKSFTTNLYQTIIVVMTVVILFLGFRAGIIVGMIVPSSILLAIIVMRLFEIELHRVSIASMIISLGLLVDNGIVMVEEISRRIIHGEARKEAAINAAKELGFPLLSSSLTTVLAFTPLLLAENVTGEYTRSLAQVILITLLGSWFLAMYVTPLFCYWFIKPKKNKAERNTSPIKKLYSFYHHQLLIILQHKVLFTTLMIAALIISLWGFKFVPRQFFPASDRNQYLVYLDLSAGSSTESTEAQTKAVLRWLNTKNPEVKHTLSYIGYGGARFLLTIKPFDPTPNQAVIIVTTHQAKDIPKLIARTDQHIQDHYPQLFARVKQTWLGSAENDLIEVRISGESANMLNQIAQKVIFFLEAIPSTYDIKNDWENKNVKITLNIDQAKAQLADISSENIALLFQTYLSGSEISEFHEEESNIPITVRAEQKEEYNLDNIRTASVHSYTTNKSVPLLQIAQLSPSFQYSQIKRFNLERTITITAKNTELGSKKVLQQLIPKLKQLDLPLGYSWEIAGEEKASKDAQTALFKYLPLCFLFIVLLLIWQFNSFRKMAIVILTLPFSLIGATIGLLITNSIFGFMAILGILSLAGIIANNAIVLLERIELELEQHKHPIEAVIHATMTRAKPILMTTLTTILGLLPLVFFGGPLWFAMANVIIFGLGIGTLISLGIVPIFYCWFYNIKFEQKALHHGTRNR